MSLDPTSINSDFFNCLANLTTVDRYPSSICARISNKRCRTYTIREPKVIPIDRAYRLFRFAMTSRKACLTVTIALSEFDIITLL